MIAGRFNIRVFGTLVVPAMLMASCSSSSNSEAQPSATVSTYQGQWNGSYRINSSAPVPSAAYAHMCNGWAPGVVLPLSITMTQNGQSVIGQFTTNDSLVVTVVSPSFVSIPDSTSTIQVRSVFPSSFYQYDFMWRLSLTGPSQISGTVSLSRTGSAGLVGGCNIEGTIVSLTK